MAAGLQPAAARRRVFGERDAVPACGFGRRGNLRDRASVEQVDLAARCLGVLKDETHRPSLPRARSSAGCGRSNPIEVGSNGAKTSGKLHVCGAAPPLGPSGRGKFCHDGAFDADHTQQPKRCAPEQQEGSVSRWVRSPRKSGRDGSKTAGASSRNSCRRRSSQEPRRRCRACFPPPRSSPPILIPRATSRFVTTRTECCQGSPSKPRRSTTSSCTTASSTSQSNCSGSPIRGCTRAWSARSTEVVRRATSKCSTQTLAITHWSSLATTPATSSSRCSST